MTLESSHLKEKLSSDCPKHRTFLGIFCCTTMAVSLILTNPHRVPRDHFCDSLRDITPSSFNTGVHEKILTLKTKGSKIANILLSIERNPSIHIEFLNESGMSDKMKVTMFPAEQVRGGLGSTLLTYTFTPSEL